MNTEGTEKVVFLEIVKKGKGSVRLVLLLLIFAVLCLGSVHLVAGAEPGEIVGERVPESVMEDACEVHLGFKYDLPDSVANWNLNNLLQSGSGPVYEFIDRIVEMGESRPIYLHGFTSWEGPRVYNEKLADRRAEAMIKIMKDYIQQQGLPDITINVIKGTINSKSETFWQLLPAEKKIIDDFYKTNPTKAQKDAFFEPIQALRENRRVVLTLDPDAYSIVHLGGVGLKFLDYGCPPPLPPAECGNGIIEEGEGCEPPNNLEVCGEGKFCNEECNCVGMCVVDGIKQPYETCDPESEVTGCSENEECQQDCTCEEEKKEISKKWLWLLLLLLPLLFWLFKTRRTDSKGRDVGGDGGLIEDKSSICGFLAGLLMRKKELIQSIRGLEEKIAAKSPEVKKRFGDYVSNFRDVAYLRDRTSQESKSLEAAEDEIKELFEDYFSLVIDLLELERLEATLVMLLEKLNTGIKELNESKTSSTLDKLQIKLTEHEADDLEIEILPKLESEARYILDEISKIETTIEEHVREMGLTISGIVSVLGKDRHESKIEKKYGAGAFKELWWVKKNLRFHAPIYLRKEEMRRTGERHFKIWPFWTKEYNRRVIFGKWEHDLQVTTEEGSEEEKKWKARMKQIWGGKDIKAKSAYLQKLGQDIAQNVEKDQHLLSNLFSIVKIDDEKDVQGLARTGDVKGLNQDALFDKGLRYGGKLQDEIYSLLKMIKILCAGRQPLSVKIEAPKGAKVQAHRVKEIFESKEAFKAKITGGRSPYKFIWHWGQYIGDTRKGIGDQVDGNLAITGAQTKPLTPTQKDGKSRAIELAKGFNMLMKKASQRPEKGPFNRAFSVDGAGEKFLLHITIQDGAGKIASDNITIEVTSKNIIKGRVVELDNPVKGIEGATVWVEHSEFPDGKVRVEYAEEGKNVEAVTDKTGVFRIEGGFRYNITVHAQKGEGRGANVLEHGAPKGPFNIPEGQKEVKDVVVSLLFRSKAPKLVRPEAIDEELKNNMSRLAGTEVKNHVKEVLARMRVKAGNDISLQKFVFGPKDLPQNPDIKRMQGFVEQVYGENVQAARSVIAVIEEKKKLISDYVDSLKKFEKDLQRLAEEKANEDDEEYFNLYEKMIHCFTDIREYVKNHRMLDTLELLEMELKGLIDLEFEPEHVSMDDKTFVSAVNIRNDDDLRKWMKQIEYRAKSKNKIVDDMLCEIYRWKRAQSERWEDPGFLVERFDEIAADMQKQINTLHQELGRLAGVIDENYHHWQEYLQQLHDMLKTRYEAKKKAAGAEWIS